MSVNKDTSFVLLDLDNVDLNIVLLFFFLPKVDVANDIDLSINFSTFSNSYLLGFFIIISTVSNSYLLGFFMSGCHQISLNEGIP